VGMVRGVVVEMLRWVRIVRGVYLDLGTGIWERWRVVRERRFIWLVCWIQLLEIGDEGIQVALELDIYWQMLTSLLLWG
jgi:hypothetical protein